MQRARQGAMGAVKGIDPRALIGSACLWAWVDALYKSGFFAPFRPVPLMPELAVWFTFLLIVPLSALVLWQKERVRALCARKGCALVCGVAGSAGSALFAVSASTAAGSFLR